MYTDLKNLQGKFMEEKKCIVCLTAKVSYYNTVCNECVYNYMNQHPQIRQYVDNKIDDLYDRIRSIENGY